ncbi:MAG: peptidoglycan-binding protein [bacterium]|nr:peptidoglycan-binding protein [bacterium]
MKKNIFTGLIIAAVLVVGGNALPLSASALTVGDIQVQIKELLAKIADLTRQMNELRTQQVPPVATVTTSTDTALSPSKHRICSILYRNISRGMQGDDVQSLQEFLSEEGYLSANATGYFGQMTAQAVANWQTSQGVSPVGSVGPMTRERIKTWCGNPNTEQFSAQPQRGTAPLAVVFKTNITLMNPRMIADAGDYKIVFGDGGEYVLPCTSAAATCQGPHRVEHTYRADGTYTASLVHFGYFGPPGPDGNPSTSVARITIYVGPQMCTKEYIPVCGSKPIVCITTPCNPIQQTYGNRCEMKADGASLLYEGECKDTSINPANDPLCKSWYDGCNSCSRQTPGSPAMCTLRACIDGSTAKPYCTAYFDKDTSGNKPPVISSFSGPTSLAVNQQGTWTIQASDPENGQLTYIVYWTNVAAGTDSFLSSAASYTEVTQNTTFTHSYSSVGTYTVSIIVRDSAGQEAKTTSTVKVGSDAVACTMEYNPVCGQPPEPACRRSIPACMMATPGPQTYGNRCVMNVAGASFLYNGACNSVAVQ